MSKFRELNIRDVGGGVVPKGLFIRSGKLSLLTKEECAMLCDRLGIKCVIDLRTPIESAEFLDPLPECVEYLQIPLLFHCTAGKDRTRIVSMALLKSYGVSNEEIVRDYMRTNRNAFWPTMKKCLGIGLMTWNLDLVRTAYKAFMADDELIRTAMKNYEM